MGLLLGYLLPIVLMKALAYVLYEVGVTQVYGTIATLLIIYLAFVAPLLSGYFGAKYSSKLPMLNGIVATLFGLLALFTLGQFNGAIIYIAFVILAVAFGYLGSRRFVLHG